jgi:hypothetical protein
LNEIAPPRQLHRYAANIFPMDVLNEYIGFIGEGYLEAADKLKECRFFLNLMKRTTAFDDFRWFTNAFLSASRAVMDWLATSAYYAIPGEGPWEMEEDPRAIAILSKHFSMRRTKSGKVFAESPVDPLLQNCVMIETKPHTGDLFGSNLNTSTILVNSRSDGTICLLLILRML